MSRSSLNIFLFLLLALFWSGSFVAIKEVVHQIDPLFAAFYRLIIASTTLLIAALITGVRFNLSWQERYRHWTLGVLGIGLPFALLFWGEQSVSAGMAGMINGSVPIWTALFISFFAFEKDRADLHFKSLFGIGVGFVGIVLVFLPLLQSSTNASLFGGLAILGMALCYALANVVNRILITKPNATKMQAALLQQHFASTVFLGTIAFLFSRPPSWDELTASKWVIPSLFYLGIFSTALALSIYFYLLKAMGSLKTSSITYLIPAISVFLDYLIFKTIPHSLSILGILLVFLGVFYVRSSKPPVLRLEDQKDSEQSKGNA